MLFSPKESGQGMIEMIGIIVIVVVLCIGAYALIQPLLFPNLPSAREILG